MTRERLISAKRASVCSDCRRDVYTGDAVYWVPKASTVRHADCGQAAYAADRLRYAARYVRVEGPVPVDVWEASRVIDRESDATLLRQYARGGLYEQRASVGGGWTFVPVCEVEQ